MSRIPSDNRSLSDSYNGVNFCGSDAGIRQQARPDVPAPGRKKFQAFCVSFSMPDGTGLKQTKIPQPYKTVRTISIPVKKM